MPLVDRALWHIENRLSEPMTLEELAGQCAASPYHLSRAFRSALGVSPIAYLRARRLSEAARAIARGEDDILSVALDAQYGSHEAFTRAFAARFGVLPSTVRAARSTADLDLKEPTEMDHSRLIDVPPPRFEDHPAFDVVGLSLSCTHEQLSGIPTLWRRYAARLDALGEDPEVTYGICHGFDDEGRFTYLSGSEARPGQAVPDGMERITVDAGFYAVFSHAGHISDIGRTTHTIWNRSLPDLGLEPRTAAEFERYDRRFDARTGRGEVEIWIPVERAQ